MSTTNLHHFTDKMYLVTFERSHGLGNMRYGIMQVFNKPKAAQHYLKNLIKEQEKQDFFERSKTSYGLKIVDLSNPLTTELFRYNY
jgi:hypothetical protein